MSETVTVDGGVGHKERSAHDGVSEMAMHGVYTRMKGLGGNGAGWEVGEL